MHLPDVIVNFWRSKTIGCASCSSASHYYISLSPRQQEEWRVHPKIEIESWQSTHIRHSSQLLYSLYFYTSIRKLLIMLLAEFLILYIWLINLSNIDTWLPVWPIMDSLAVLASHWLVFLVHALLKLVVHVLEKCFIQKMVPFLKI